MMAFLNSDSSETQHISAFSCVFKYLATPNLMPTVYQCLTTIVHRAFEAAISWLILSLLPPLEGKSVIELGAGIGNYTTELTKKADNVLAMDFIESAIKKNEETNCHFKNVKFMCADVIS